MWPQTTGAVTPLFLAKRSLYYLPKFKWYEDMRPLSPGDIFIVPAAMEELMLEKGRPIPVIPRPPLPPLHFRPDGALPDEIPSSQTDQNSNPTQP